MKYTLPTQRTFPFAEVNVSVNRIRYVVQKTPFLKGYISFPHWEFYVVWATRSYFISTRVVCNPFFFQPISFIETIRSRNTYANNIIVKIHLGTYHIEIVV